MSRSKRKPYYKDKGMTTQEYWKPIRSSWKQFLKQNYMDEDIVFKHPKNFHNDWDYCDWRWEIYVSKESCMSNRLWSISYWDEEDVKKASRK